jgi:hypothetical protein
MPSFSFLDVAIGLIFVFLLLSLICSSLNEGMESFLRNRAIDLEAAIRNLLGDKPGSWWASVLPWINSVKADSITRDFYSHPLIRSLVRTENRLPTYIPSRNFALAVMDMVGEQGHLLRGATQTSPGSAPAAVTLEDTINKSPLPDNLKKSIEALYRAANGDIPQTRLNIEKWFNSSMDRVSGWYKSRTQKILFCIGVVVTIAVNADSIAIFQNLSHSKNLQAIVNAASSATGAQPPLSPEQQTPVNKAMDQLNALDIGIGWASEKEQQKHGPTVDTSKLPLSLNKNSCGTEQRPCTDRIGWIVHLLYLHGVGWLITAAAISLGAPFWFDTLNRFMVVRSTVKPSEKSSEEPSKG